MIHKALSGLDELQIEGNAIDAMYYVGNAYPRRWREAGDEDFRSDDYTSGAVLWELLRL